MSLSCILALTFCLQMTPVFQLAELALGRYRDYWPIARVTIVGLVATAAAALPNMEQMISLTGSVAFATIGFSLPGAFYLKLRPNRSCHDAIVSYLLVLLGVVGGGFGVYSTFAAGVQPG